MTASTVNSQAADTAPSAPATSPAKSAPRKSSSLSSSSTRSKTTRITTTVRIARPRASVRRSSSSSSSTIFSTKTLAAAVRMVTAKASEPGPLPVVPKPPASSPSSTSSSSAATPTTTTTAARPSSHHKSHSQHRVTKPTGGIGSRSSSSSNNNARVVSASASASKQLGSSTLSMDPPVQSFYGAEPIPLPARFATIKRRLIEGKEAAIAASWRRLLDALRAETEHISRRGASLIPTIDFGDLDDAARTESFGRDLRRHGVALVRGVVSREQTENWIRQTREYLIRNRDHVKPTIPQDPTCFELFWTPAQIAIRAHPAVLRVQRWAMTFWETKGTDADLSCVATRFPIAYADRLRIHDATIMPTLGGGGSSSSSSHHPQQQHPHHPLNGNSAADSLSSAPTLIAQVDNGSLERWEPDGYGRGGAYAAVFDGRWEDLDPWDPSGRIHVTQDLYNGAGACSIFRMFQGILALTSGEPASIRVLPSPKLVMAYLLLRPFFSPRTPAPANDDDDNDNDSDNEAAWDAFLAPDNWALDAEQSTVIHGAVPGHAQRITELWHPHLRLRRSLVETPALGAGDYVLWHCDTAYSIVTTSSSSASSPPPAPSMLMYTPACPLTQTNALFLARQRKAFARGQPGPDFDSAGGAMGSEAPHEGRPGAGDIAAVGGDAGLRAMGLAPWELSRDGTAVMTTEPCTRAGTPEAEGEKQQQQRQRSAPSSGASTEGEAEVVRLANIILFPDRYDFYIPTEAASASAARIGGRAQAEQMAATRQLISRILS